MSGLVRWKGRAMNDCDGRPRSFYCPIFDRPTRRLLIGCALGTRGTFDVSGMRRSDGRTDGRTDEKVSEVSDAVALPPPRAADAAAAAAAAVVKLFSFLTSRQQLPAVHAAVMDSVTPRHPCFRIDDKAHTHGTYYLTRLIHDNNQKRAACSTFQTCIRNSH